MAWELGPPLRIWREASADYLRMACDRSLEALGLDQIDLYQVHWPVAGVPATETIGALEDLRTAGKIRAIGVSNYHLPDLEAAGAAGRIDSFQPGYHLMRRDIEDGELDWCGANGVGVIAYGPLAHGLLTGKMTAATTFGCRRLALPERAVRRRRLRRPHRPGGRARGDRPRGGPAGRGGGAVGRLGPAAPGGDRGDHRRPRRRPGRAQRRAGRGGRSRPTRTPPSPPSWRATPTPRAATGTASRPTSRPTSKLTHGHARSRSSARRRRKARAAALRPDAGGPGGRRRTGRPAARSSRRSRPCGARGAR